MALTREMNQFDVAALPLAAQLEQLRLLYKVGLALSVVKNKDQLVEMILLEAKSLCHADGGTLYLRTEDDQLRFDMVHTDSLGLALGGTSSETVNLPPIPLRKADGLRNMSNVASCATWEKKSIRIDDAYHTADFDFSGTRKFDERNGYRSQSFLTCPLVNADDRVIAVLQLINARDRKSGKTIPFRAEQQRIVEALVSQAAVALDNQLLRDAQDQLLDSFIRVIAESIDEKSPYTGGHCKRVPIILELLIQAVVESDQAPFADFTLDDDGWREVRIAGWLHDCGKIITPVHVMDKATKLEAFADRMDVLRGRFDLLRRDIEMSQLASPRSAANGASGVESIGNDGASRVSEDLERLAEDLAFLERINVGGEWLSPDDVSRLRAIGKRTVVIDGKHKPLLTEAELDCLSVARGTLTKEERLTINRHMVQTINMLEALPFPRNLRRVPEYAGGHHEKMDGTGYPRGIFAGDMSLPARALAIADVFEALTAEDRPYKSAKPLSEALRIMGEMKRANHLDPDLFDLFVREKVYLKYAENYLSSRLVDDVEEQALLAIAPNPLKLPPLEVRKKRWERFLPEYEEDAVS